MAELRSLLGDSVGLETRFPILWSKVAEALSTRPARGVALAGLRPTEVAVRCIRNHVPRPITRVAFFGFPSSTFQGRVYLFRYARVDQLVPSPGLEPGCHEDTAF